MENNEKRSIERSRRFELIRQTIMFALVIVLLVVSVTFFAGFYSRQNLLLIKQNVKRTAIECYSIEGMYPPNIDYIVDNYSFYYDSDKYFIFYETFASNVMPTIEVYERK